MRLRDSSRVLSAAAYAAILGFFVLHAYYLRCVAEDSHITFRYARHLAEGHGIVWNIGEQPPIEGYTNFLWVVLMAGLLRAGLDIFVGSQLLGTLAALGAIELARRYARRFLGCDPWIALLPCALLAVSGPMATWASSGMETSLFGFMVMAAVYANTAYWDAGRSGWLWAVACAALLATLLRPEGLMVFCLLLGANVVVASGQLGKTLRAHALPLALYAVPFGLYMAWRISYFGDPLPNTFYAKTGGGAAQYQRGADYVGNFAGFYLTPLLLAVVLWLWEGRMPRGPERPSLRGVRVWLRQSLPVAGLVYVGLVYLLYVAAVGGDYMAMYRFMVPVLPMIYLLVAAMFGALSSALEDAPRKYAVAVGALGLMCAATFLHSTYYEELWFRQPDRQHGHHRGVQTERWHVARLTEIGKLFDRYKQSPKESLATRAIGATGYFAHMDIHDLMGLTDPVVARYDNGRAGTGWAGHEKLYLDYSFGRLPTYLMFDRNVQEEIQTVPPLPDGRPDLVNFILSNYPKGRRFTDWIGENVDFVNDHYQVTTIWMDDPVNREAGYFSFFELKDHAESGSGSVIVR